MIFVGSLAWLNYHRCGGLLIESKATKNGLILLNVRKWASVDVCLIGFFLRLSTL